MIRAGSAGKASNYRLVTFFIVVVALLMLASVSLIAQEEEEKGEAFKGGVKVEGELHCQKSDPAYSITVPDREGHALMLSKRQCTWTKPLTIAGAETKSGETVDFIEQMEGRLHVHGFGTYSLGSEKFTIGTMGQVFAEKGPAETRGRWSMRKGTGKFRGIRGGGDYQGKLEANEELNLNFKGVYLPDSLGGEKKDQK